MKLKQTAINILNTQQSNDADYVIVQNANISSGLVLEQNEKQVFDIYLNTLAKGLPVFDSLQLASLQNIAFQCPLTGGTAVFKARSLLALVEENVNDNSILCTSGQGSLRELPNDINIHQSTFGLYPNPASQNVTLVLQPLETDSYLAIFDSFGKQVNQLKIPKKVPSLVINLENLSSGIYFFNLTNPKKDFPVQKLIITK